MPSLEVEPDDRVDERFLGRDLHPVDRVDERREVVHVEQDVAVDLRAVERLHGADQRLHALVGVERVDLSGIRRPIGEGHVDRVARERDERQLRLVGREADEHQRIGVDRLARLLSVRVAVGADVQDRPPPVHELGRQGRRGGWLGSRLRRWAGGGLFRRA